MWPDFTTGGSMVPVQRTEELALGDIVPGVVCTHCGAELLATTSGGFCESCQAFVPIIGTAAVIPDNDTDWTDDDA